MKNGLYILFGWLIFSCGSSGSLSEKDEQAYQNLKSLVDSKQLTISSHTARPMVTTAFQQVANTNILGVGNTSSNISIIGNVNNLHIHGDSISGFLPFYGEQNFGGGSYGAGGHQGIEFKGVPEGYEITENKGKKSIQLQFQIDDQYRTNERYNIYVTLYANNTSNIRVLSTNRSSIEYIGTVKALPKEAELK